MQVLAVLISIVPGILWLYVFYRTDLYEPEPKRLVLALFGLGAAAVIPAWLVEKAAAQAWPALDFGRSDHFLPLVAGCFLVIGPVEELCKFLVVRATVYRHPEFDEPLDGIIYAAAAALGFASLENILYVVDFGHGGAIKWHMLALRSVLALPGHVIFAACWGYALGRRKFERYPVAPMLLGAAWLHAAYDFVLLYPPARPAIPVVLAIMFPLVVRQIRSLQRRSPFAPRSARASAALAVATARGTLAPPPDPAPAASDAARGGDAT